MDTKKQLYQIPQITKAPEVRHIRSPKSLRSCGFGLRASIKFGSAVGAVYPCPCKPTISSLPTIYFIESDSDHLFEFYDWGWIQISNDAAPTALLFILASLYPTEMLRIPMWLRICRPETGLVSSLNKWMPFFLSVIYSFKWNLFCSHYTPILRNLSYTIILFLKHHVFFTIPCIEII